MKNKMFEIEPNTLFSESLIWQINRDYYQKEGLDAWSKNVVPHNLTSNSMVARTYAELIFAFLRDLADKGQTTETVYLIELGAGHGRLAFHILKHLQVLEELYQLELAPFCYIVSDIVEDNLTFFQHHPQFKSYFEQGLLEVAYYDATQNTEIQLRYSGKKITKGDLAQPILVIANYFFDSIPNDLFLIQNKTISACSVALSTQEDPKEMDETTLLKSLELVFDKKPFTDDFYEEEIMNELLKDYQQLLVNTHLFFPKNGLKCLDQLRNFSQQGLMVISMDKGFHELHELEKLGEPEIIRHGSFSLWVNYHAYGEFCKKQGGKALYPDFANFYVELGCLLFLPDAETYTATNAAYQRFVNDFGPDDFNGIKRMAYQHLAKLPLKELIALLRLSNYDSTLFKKILPRIKQVYHQVSFKDRHRLSQTMHKVWEMYFTINESLDLAYEMGGISYDLGFYNDALTYFQYSVNDFGEKADIYYNQILCYYQLRADDLFIKTLKKAKLAFPDYARFAHLETLDLGAT